MRRFHADLHPIAQRVDREKVGPIGGMVLFVISEAGETTAQSIASTLRRDKSQVSRVVSLLVRKGLVEKFANDDDARSSRLRLTEKGMLQVAAFNGALVETTANILVGLDRNEVRQFSELLAKILD
ncbi:MAG: winged helix DNA-binding protein [Pseudomonadota bacterium]